MPLDAHVKADLDARKASNSPPISAIPIETLRREFNSAMTQLNASLPPIPIAATLDRTIPAPAHEIPVRIYTPEGNTPFPVIMYFHGGGFIGGNLDMQDTICRILFREVSAVVVSVDYRLAPEYKFPAAPEDCFAATRWVADHAAEIGGDATRIAVAGSSSGGNLAAVTALQARNEGSPLLRGQLLVNPVIDLREPHTRSAHENGHRDYGLSLDEMAYFKNQYLSSVQEADHPLASPCCANDLSGLPPALIITCEYDMLRDEGEAYAQSLSEAGVPATAVRYDGLNHDIFALPLRPGKSEEAMRTSCTWLKEVLRA